MVDEEMAQTEHKSLSDTVYEHIKEMIISLEIKGGDKIPEAVIAKKFGVSRTPIREAIRKLDKEGLVKLYPRRYAEVITISQKDIINIGLVRISLDTLAVQLVIQNGSNADCDELEKVATQCLDYALAKNKRETIKYDTLFHKTMVEISKNPFLLRMMEDLHLKVQLLQNRMWEISQLKEGVKLHLPLIDKLRERDAEGAIEICQEHLINFYGLQNHPVIKRIKRLQG